MNAEQEKSVRTFRPSIPHMFYAVALFGASIAVWGPYGALIATAILFGWWYTFAHRNRALGLLQVFVVGSMGAIGVAYWLHSREQNIDRREQSACFNNLKQIGAALSRYHRYHGSFPPARIVDNKGRPLHSWRALILPYLKERDRYSGYDFDSAWDGQRNAWYTRYAPRVYRCPTHQQKGQSPYTSYFAVTGNGTAWSDGEGMTLGDLNADGRGNTILVIEVHGAKVPWTEPKDISLETAIKLISDSNRPGPHTSVDFPNLTTFRFAVFADFELRRVRQGVGIDDATAMIRIDDGREPSSKAARRSTFIYRDRRTDRFLRMFLLLIIWVLPLCWIVPRRRAWKGPLRRYEMND